MLGFDKIYKKRLFDLVELPINYRWECVGVPMKRMSSEEKRRRVRNKMIGEIRKE